MIAYVDCFCGIAGDMLLGALVDAGAPLAQLRRELARLPLRGYTIRSARVMRGPVRCTKVDVRVARHGHHHTSAREILSMIRKSRLPEAVRKNSSLIFERLAEAEGQVHGIAPAKVKFHEVGAVDSIVDIVGTCIALDLLEVTELTCSAIPMSGGTVRTEHGLLPVPGPATLALLEGFPMTPTGIVSELVTPTGAAILSALVKKPGHFPDLTLARTGYGAGDYDLPQRPDFLRVLVGHRAAARRGDVAVLIETNLDDMPGQDVGHLFDVLFNAGALDVFTTPIQMKKSRPAIQLSVLSSPDLAPSIEGILLRETTTFGLRRRLVERTTLDRRFVPVKTRYGTIRMKVGSQDGTDLKATPEFEDLRNAAHRYGVPLSHVRKAAHQIFAIR